MKVYLDNGSTTMVDPRVAKEMITYFTDNYGNASSLHDLGQNAKEALEKARSIIAQSINASPDEIIFTSGGSESDNLAIFGIASKPGHIITTAIEHPAVQKSCEELEKKGFEVTYLDVDKNGLIKIEQLKKSIKKNTILVSIIHANNEIGSIQDLNEIGKICKEHNICFHSDAVQSYTKVPIDVQNTNIDLISFSSHKIHGPKGIGALYVKKGTKIHSLILGGSHEFNLRAGTENIPGIIGFAKAVQLALQYDTSKIQELRDYLINRILKEIPHTILNGPRENRLCNNINISFRYIEGEGLLLHLNSKGISVSTGSACSSRSLKPSHVLTAIGLSDEIAHGSIRFTLSRFTTKKELNYTLKSLKEVVENLRKISPLMNKIR